MLAMVFTLGGIFAWVVYREATRAEPGARSPEEGARNGGAGPP